MKTIVIDIDDVQDKYIEQIDKLVKLNKLIHNIKFTLFYVPNLLSQESRTYINLYKNFLELVPHGLNHTLYECKDLNYDDSFYLLGLVKNKTNGFKAPNWLVSQELLECIKDLDMWIAVHPKQEQLAKEIGCKYYCYNSLITAPFDKELTKATGHIHIDCYHDDIDSAWYNLIKLVDMKNVEYKFVSDFF
jgi:hypothetical protein